MESIGKQAMANRLEAFRKAKKLKQNVLAQTLGVTTGFMSNVLSGRSDMTKSFLQALAKSFQELNIDWLMHGRGSMLVTDQDSPMGVVQEPAQAYERAAPGVFALADALLSGIASRLEVLEQELERTRAAAVVLEVRVKGLEAQLREKG
jgi:transcriptional regulator with XRE-family HTH domain